MRGDAVKNCKWLFLLIVPCVVALVASPGLAYNRAGDCDGCHQNFKGPGEALHDMHVGASQMTNNCDLCHTNVGDDPRINSSAAGVSCVGCHIPEGLWQRHQASGQSCAPCHTNWSTPEIEPTAPPYYGRGDVALTSPCLIDKTMGGEDYSGDGKGLDNDGNTFYDALDPECILLPVEETTWGRVKSLYLE